MHTIRASWLRQSSGSSFMATATQTEGTSIAFLGGHRILFQNNMHFAGNNVVLGIRFVFTPMASPSIIRFAVA